MKTLLGKVKCADGFTISIQASSFHYCSPRDDEGPYTHVECGFPSEHEPLLDEYCGDLDNPTDTVYGYVPRSVIEAVMAKHNAVALKEIE
jgi:hypothetical protein